MNIYSAWINLINVAARLLQYNYDINTLVMRDWDAKEPSLKDHNLFLLQLQEEKKHPASRFVGLVMIM